MKRILTTSTDRWMDRVRGIRFLRGLPMIVAVLLTLCGMGQRAVAAAGTVTQFPLSGTFLFPESITTGPDGALWFLESGHIGRISTSGTVTQFTGPTGNSITSGPDGALWFTESSQGMIARFTTTGSLKIFALPGNPPPYRRIAERPQTITVGPDGALWFTVQIFSSTCVCVTGGKIGRITTGGTITEFTLPTGTSKVTTPLVGGIATGPDGALWFTDSRLRKIGRMTTAGVLTQFAVPHGSPQGITTGPDGALWFTANSGTSALVSRITTAGVFTEYTVATDPDNVSVGPQITTGPDGNLWTTDYPSLTAKGTILRVSTAGHVTAFPQGEFDEVDGITPGPDTAMWFTKTNNQSAAGFIGRITTH